METSLASNRGAVVVDADRRAVEGVELGRVGLPVARVCLPEVGAVEELEAGAGEVDRLERVDEAEELAGAPEPKSSPSSLTKVSTAGPTITW